MGLSNTPKNNERAIAADGDDVDDDHHHRYIICVYLFRPDCFVYIDYGTESAGHH